MTEVIYSQQRNGFVEGRTYLNPRFFERPMPGVDKVLIVGDWPKIAHAYTALNVPVEIVEGDQVRAVAGAEVAPHPLVQAIPDPDERAKVYIPDDWESLPWSRPTDAGLTLRGLAAVFSDTPVLNKDDARQAIGAELSRRRSEETASNGLTRREMNADLESMGVEVEPVLDIEELAKLHAEKRDGTADGQGA